MMKSSSFNKQFKKYLKSQQSAGFKQFGNSISSQEQSQAVKITHALTQYTALSDQPLSAEDNQRCSCLLSVQELCSGIPSLHHITETLLPSSPSSSRRRLWVYVGLHIDSPTIFSGSVWGVNQAVDALLWEVIPAVKTLHKLLTNERGRVQTFAPLQVLLSTLELWWYY